MLSCTKSSPDLSFPFACH
ncbi:hypothetical protein D043_0423A, partial [Vibrio parahaemolyticus EKP-021]